MFMNMISFTTHVSVPSIESLRTHVPHSHIFGECYTNVRKYEKFINTKFQRTLLRDYVHIMCRSHCFMCPRYTSCRRNLVVQDHVYMILYHQGPCTCYISRFASLQEQYPSYMIPCIMWHDHILNTRWILWKCGWWIPYHL